MGDKEDGAECREDRDDGCGGAMVAAGGTVTSGGGWVSIMNSNREKQNTSRNAMTMTPSVSYTIPNKQSRKGGRGEAPKRGNLIWLWDDGGGGGSDKEKGGNEDPTFPLQP